MRCCITACSGTCVRAQNGIIRGKLLDAADGAPVPFAMVRLLTAPQQGYIYSCRGLSSFSKLMPYTYRLQATFVGYDSNPARLELAATFYWGS